MSSEIKVYEKKRFTNIDYTGKVLRNKEFYKCTFVSCIFLKSDLIGNDFEDCIFESCDFFDDKSSRGWF